jgi:SAM-dependent methyltransferase
MSAASRVSFDGQASDFDQRAGLPHGVGRRIAVAVADLVPKGGVLLDLGAGTGQIGESLARLGVLYVAIDLSAPMLAVFRDKLGGGDAAEAEPGPPQLRATLVQADACTRWPIASGSVDAVFVSRAAHLMPSEVLVRELSRVVRPSGGVVVFGGVRTDPASLRAVLRREMRRLLAEDGVLARNAGAFRDQLGAALEEQGWEVLPARTATTWPVVHRARESLAAWRAKPGLGGRAIAPEVQERVLRRLEDWIRERHGGLDIERDATERYELSVVRLPGRSISDRTHGGMT